MKKMRYVGCALLAVVLGLQIPITPVRAEGEMVLALGADLTEDQKQNMLDFFGVNPDEVTVITVTNEDERKYLSGYISGEKIGNRTFSSALLKLTGSDGIQVKTANMDYVTSNMIASALSTSGATNCEVLTGAPFTVSGTGSLTGALMAYEQAAGRELEAEKKDLANYELMTTVQLGEEIDMDLATLIVNDLKIRLIRDEVTGEAEIGDAVDQLIESVKTEAAEQAHSDVTADLENLDPAQIDSLKEFGEKLSRTDYDYSDMDVTLQRVSGNESSILGIEDPVVNAADLSEVETPVSEDSILLHSDDSALGEDANINSTIESIIERNQNQFANPVTDVEIIPKGRIEASHFVSGTSLILSENSHWDYALSDLDGNILTDYLYSDRFEYIEGYIIGALNNSEVNNSGMMSLGGEEMIPFEYGYVEVYSNRWAAGLRLNETDDDGEYASWSAGYHDLEEADIYYISDGQAQKIVTLPKDHFESAAASGDLIMIQDRGTGTASAYDKEFNLVKEGMDYLYDTDDLSTSDYEVFRDDSGKEGVKDNKGNIVIPPVYDSVIDESKDGYFKIESEDYKEGLLDLKGNEILPAIYDVIQTNYYSPVMGTSIPSDKYSAYGYYCITQNGKLGYAVKGGRITCQPLYVSSLLDNEGVVSVYTETDGSRHMYAADGVETDLGTKYSLVMPLEYSSGILLSALSEETYDYDIIDWHGNLIVSNASASMSGDGKYMLVTASDTYEESADLYEIIYNTGADAGIEGAEPAKTAEPASAGQTAENVQSAVESREAEPEAADEAVENSADSTLPDESDVQDMAGTDIINLLEASKTLLGDIEANRDSLNILLGQASDSIDDTNVAAKTLLQSVIGSLEDEADAGKILSLIESVEKLLQ